MQIIKVAAIKLFDINSLDEFNQYRKRAKLNEWIITDSLGAKVMNEDDYKIAVGQVTAYAMLKVSDLIDFDRSKLKLHQSGTAFSNAWAGMITDFSNWVKRKIK